MRFPQKQMGAEFMLAKSSDASVLSDELIDILRWSDRVALSVPVPELPNTPSPVAPCEPKSPGVETDPPDVPTSDVRVA